MKAKIFTRREISFINAITAKTTIVKLSRRTQEYLLVIASNVLSEVLQNVLTLTEHRYSMIPSVEDASSALDILKRDLTFITSVKLPDSEQEFESDDEDYASESDSESDSEDSESVSSEESEVDEEDEDDEEDEEEMEIDSENENSDMDNMYSDKENLSPLIDIFSLSSPKTNVAFRDFVFFILETRFHCGLEMNDDVTYLLEEWLTSQVSMSFHAEPECWLTRGGVPPLGFLNELYLVTTSTEQGGGNEVSVELNISNTQNNTTKEVDLVASMKVKKSLADFDHNVVNQQHVVVQKVVRDGENLDDSEREKMALLYSFHGADTYNSNTKPNYQQNDYSNNSDTPQYINHPQTTTTNSNMKTPISSYHHYLEVDDEVSRDSVTLLCSDIQGSAETAPYDIQSDNNNANNNINNNNSRQTEASLNMLKDRRILYLEQRLREMEGENSVLKQQQVNTDNTQLISNDTKRQKITQSNNNNKKADFTSPLVAMFNTHNPQEEENTIEFNTTSNTSTSTSLRTPLQTLIPYGSPQTQIIQMNNNNKTPFKSSHKRALSNSSAQQQTPIQIYSSPEANNNNNNTSNTTEVDNEEVFTLSPNITMRNESRININNITASGLQNRGGVLGSVSSVGFGSPPASSSTNNTNTAINNNISSSTGGSSSGLIATNVNTPSRHNPRTPRTVTSTSSNTPLVVSSSFPIFQDSSAAGVVNQLSSANSAYQNAMREASTPARNTRQNNNNSTINTPLRVQNSNNTNDNSNTVQLFHNENDVTYTNTLPPPQSQSVLFSPQPVSAVAARRRNSIVRNDRSEF